ncbi:hypothetical protein GCM10022393_34340 [Aquimarina addita]|uniref:DUF4199 domain-containing protein n=1 Tax=Aquimarina addita TaxID=870485 RepID=A0ABP6UPX5_9FLAO
MINNTINKPKYHKGGMIALKYGVLCFVVFMAILPLLKSESLIYLFFMIFLFFATFPINAILMTLAFIGGLYYFGTIAEKDLRKKANLLNASSSFSFSVDILIWFVAYLSFLLFGHPDFSADQLEINYVREHYFIALIVTLLSILVTGVLTTFTFGLLIVYRIKANLKE